MFNYLFNVLHFVNIYIIYLSCLAWFGLIYFKIKTLSSGLNFGVETREGSTFTLTEAKINKKIWIDGFFHCFCQNWLLLNVFDELVEWHATFHEVSNPKFYCFKNFANFMFWIESFERLHKKCWIFFALKWNSKSMKGPILFLSVHPVCSEKCKLGRCSLGVVTTINHINAKSVRTTGW